MDFNVNPNDRFAGQDRYVIILDFNAYMQRFHRVMADKGLTAQVEVDGQMRFIPTGAPKTVLQSLINLTRGGRCPLVVVSDLRIWSRKAYFKKGIETGQITSKSGDYKGFREPFNPGFKDSCDLTLNLLRNSGCWVLNKENYEADDLMPEVIRVAKAQFPELPIHIIANDLDLAPLVDEQVSLYRTPAKETYAEPGYMTLNKYEQITPRNYQEVMQRTSFGKNLKIPYNSLLLAKLFRGDKSDNIDILPKWTPKRYNKLVSQMIEDGVDLSLFSYHPWVVNYKYIPNGNVFPSLPPGYIKSQWKKVLEEPPEVQQMRDVLSKYIAPEDMTKEEKALKRAYITEEEIDEVIYRYHGMNLNGAFLDLYPTERRAPFTIKNRVQIPNLDVPTLVKKASVYNMNFKY